MTWLVYYDDAMNVGKRAFTIPSGAETSSLVLTATCTTEAEAKAYARGYNQAEKDALET